MLTSFAVYAGNAGGTFAEVGCESVEASAPILARIRCARINA